MRRRAFLATALGTPAFGGCLTAPSVTDEEGHPFADSVVTVGVQENTDTPHDIIEITNRALSFWEEHSERYAGFDITFDLRTGADVDPSALDIILAFGDNPTGCEGVPGFSPQVLGCAPIWRPSRQFPKPVVARVVASTRPIGKITITTKHEIGHILGLDHVDDPREIMSNLPQDRIPQYQLRIDIWDAIQEIHADVGVGITLYQHAVTMWNDQLYAPASEAFAEAAEIFWTAVQALESRWADVAAFETDARVETVDLAGLDDNFDRLITRISSLASAAETMSKAATAATDGDGESANRQRDVANQNLETFRTTPPVELRDIAIALGLVRGFDRDDEIVQIDEPGVEG